MQYLTLSLTTASLSAQLAPRLTTTTFVVSADDNARAADDGVFTFIFRCLLGDLKLLPNDVQVGIQIRPLVQNLLLLAARLR